MSKAKPEVVQQFYVLKNTRYGCKCPVCEHVSHLEPTFVKVEKCENCGIEFEWEGKRK